MDTVYITGHRNPDTDSIVSAMAYAALKNALGQREYQAARLGQISDETHTVLERFGLAEFFSHVVYAEEIGLEKQKKLLSEKVDINGYYMAEMDRLAKAGRKG